MHASGIEEPCRACHSWTRKRRLSPWKEQSRRPLVHWEPRSSNLEGGRVRRGAKSLITTGRTCTPMDRSGNLRTRPEVDDRLHLARLEWWSCKSSDAELSRTQSSLASSTLSFCDVTCGPDVLE